MEVAQLAGRIVNARPPAGLQLDARAQVAGQIPLTHDLVEPLGNSARTVLRSKQRLAFGTSNVEGDEMAITKWKIVWLVQFSLLTAVITCSPTPAIAQFDTAEQAAEYYDEELDDIEWEEGEGFHAEEWYDPSDWFDADEGVEYEYDDAFGYTGNSNDWYYDYYDDNSVYSDYGDNTYSSSSSYYDFDNDGVYDAYATYNDWDGDGLYEDYNYYSFATLDSSDAKDADREARQQSKQSQQQKTSKEFQVKGEVQKTKEVQVRHGKNLVALVKTDQGNVAVDLGPVDKADSWSVSEGTQIAARGPLTKVGDKALLLARNVMIDQNQASIDRNVAKLTGTIKNTKTVGVRGQQHQIAVVQNSDTQKKVLVDLGLAAKISQNLSKGDQATFHGVPVQINDRPALMANKAEVEGKTIEIVRKDQDSKQAARAESSSTQR